MSSDTPTGLGDLKIFSEESVREMQEAVERDRAAALVAREQTRKRLFDDPIAYAVAQIFRHVLAVADDSRATTQERDDAVLDGTAAILSMLDRSGVDHA